MRVPLATLRVHFPDKQNVEPEELYHWIGYPENVGNPNFENTCAIRLSLALLGAGYPNPGGWPIKAGKYKGRAIETKQRKLSNWLVRQLGQPEKFKNGLEAESKIGTRRGIV
ncbi:T6SS effector amidase Tae4 family protein [Massilia sp. GCM10020059]|uniref:Type VI secretion system amidase effector protein Tae4 n=1 Tax=Massilia agrisoli TaxID=2892444 RepID=A0ABS8IWX7_9BURK|nr:T6SS effector amidase Tae4 family protein [Massilia agrisoli]MCC6072393.1 type VI secretion system amidase effector protein Tae4 [Massilia agrisoli]